MAKPVVAFAHGALPEIVVDRETGLLIPPGDTDALAAAVVQLLQDRGLQLQMGKLGRVRVGEQFTIERTVREVEEIFQKVQKGRAGR